MTKTIATSLVIASLLALAATGAAHAQAYDFRGVAGVAGTERNTEQAVSISPAFTSTTRTECTTPASSGGWFGPALGAIIGGGAGSQVGGGSGQAAAAAIGATLGAQAGGAIAGNSGSAPQQTCRDITERVLTGYMLRTSSGRDVFVSVQIVNSFNANNR